MPFGERARGEWALLASALVHIAVVAAILTWPARQPRMVRPVRLEIRLAAPSVAPAPKPVVPAQPKPRVPAPVTPAPAPIPPKPPTPVKPEPAPVEALPPVIRSQAAKPLAHPPRPVHKRAIPAKPRQVSPRPTPPRPTVVPRPTMPAAKPAVPAPSASTPAPALAPAPRPASPPHAAPAAPPGPPPDYLAQIMGQLERYKQYPARARLRRIEGEATLWFRIDRRGKVEDHRILHGSGSDLLDEAVEEMIRQASPLPAMPDTMPQSRLEVTVPVRFELR